MTEKLKNLVIAKYSLEELVELRAFARMLFEEYRTQKMDVPEWLSNCVVAIDQEVSMKIRDSLQAKLTEARARRSQLRTAEEKRGDTDREISELEQRLGLSAGSGS